MERIRVLLVEDDHNFGLILKDYLELKDFDVTLSRDGIHGLNDFKSADFDICVLDVMMPRKDGFTLAAEIKEIDSMIPVIFLTAKSMKEDILRGYQLGADDYLIKPFDSEVLIYKIKAILSRNKELTKESEIPDYIEFGQFKFNTKLRELKIGNHVVSLSPKESALLAQLAVVPNDLVRRKDILLKIWKEDNYFTARSMDVYLAKLRKYLKKDPGLEIVNIHGEGFRLLIKEENLPASNESHLVEEIVETDED